MIRFKGVSKSYDGVTVVSDLNIGIKEGEFCVLVGESGCGKSTTLKMVNRLTEPTSGKILIKGREINSVNPENLRRSIGYVIQNTGLFPHMNVGENIAVVPKLLKWSKNKIEDRISYLMELMSLDRNSYMLKYPKELSGGQAQRVGVARALAADPEIVLMDEPFGALDPITKSKLQNELIKLQRQLSKTIIFVTHDIDEAVKMADKIIIMKEGKVLKYDTPENILNLGDNDFIKKFVGADRGLKKLSRLLVKDYMSECKFVKNTDNTKYIIEKMSGEIFLWVINDRNQLMGWLNNDKSLYSGKNISDLTETSIKDLKVTPDTSLKDVLSVMMSEGILILPVVDESGKLSGQISLSQMVANG